MGSDVSRALFRGILIEDPRIVAASPNGGTDEDLGTYTQAGPYWGVPVPLNGTDDLVLQAGGSPLAEDAGPQSYVIKSQEAGFAGRARAQFIWQDDIHATDYQGWEHPNVPAAWEPIVWADGSTYPKNTRKPDAVTLSDDTIVVVAIAKTASGVEGVYCFRRTPGADDDDAWSGPIVVYSGGEDDYHPCLVLLPEDRLLCLFWLTDPITDTANVRVMQSIDGGLTWSLYSRFALEEGINTSLYVFGSYAGRLRATYLDGGICLTAFLSTASVNQVWQWASIDLGGSFAFIDALIGDGALEQDLTVVDGGILVAILNGAEFGTDVGVLVYRLGSALSPLGSAGSVAIAPPADVELGDISTPSTVGDVSIWTDDDGIVYLAAVAGTGGSSGNWEGVLWRSVDAGVTWARVGNSAAFPGFGEWWRSAESNGTHPRFITATSQGGRQVVIHGWLNNGSADQGDHSLAALYLGGYSNLTNPFDEARKLSTGEVGYACNWYPYETPDDLGFATTGTGTQTVNAGGYLEITTSASTRYYSVTPSGTVATGVAAQWTIEMGSGGSTSGSSVAVRVSNADGSHGYRILVNYSTTQFRIIDGVASSTLATITADMDGKWVQFRLYLGAGSYALYYREGGIIGEKRQWTLAGSSSTLTDAAGSGVTAKEILWGNITSSTSTSFWRSFQYNALSTGRIGDVAQAGGQSNPGDLHGKDYSPFHYPVGENGLTLRALGGPSATGATWSIGKRYEYPIDSILPHVEPSPAVGWRSTEDAENYSITFKLAAYGATEPLNDIVGIYLDGINFEQGTLYGWTGSAWSGIGSFSAAQNQSGLTYVHNDGALRAGASGTEVAKHYFEFNELVGGTVSFLKSNGVDPCYRRIVGNTEGVWQTGSSGPAKQCTIWIDGVDGTEGASGTALSIWSPRVLMIAHLAGSLQTFQSYRLSISASNTVGGFYTIGTCVIGPVVVFGKDYDWNRSLGLGAITAMSETAAGERRTRRLNRPRRAVELPWTGGIDGTQLGGSAVSADYLLGTSTAGAQPIAFRHDTASVLSGLLDYTGGPDIPVVYLPRIPKGTPNTVTYTSRSLMMYGRIVSDWRAEVVIGTEGATELVRVPGITIEEER